MSAVRARRGAQVAAVATARKLAGLFWALLTREQDYAYGQPSLARHKIRRLELAAGAPSRKGQVRPGDGARNPAIRNAERALAQQAENAYRRTIADWTVAGPGRAGASPLCRGAHLKGPRRTKPRGRPPTPDAC